MKLKVKRPGESTPAWTNMWVAWVLLFFLIEWSALARGKREDTLSWHVWVWFGIPAHMAPSRGVRVRRLALISFLGWLSAHFLTGDDV